MRIRIFVSLTVIALQGIIYSQDMAVRPSRQAAMDSFIRGEYRKALGEFEGLLDGYSFDLYKYYSGVCLVNLKSDPVRAADYLKEAIEGSAAADIIPDDALFYLGRANQLAGRFPEALESYGKFREKAGHRKARELNVAGYVRECNERRGSLSEQELKTAAAVAAPSAEKPAGQVIEKQPPLKKEVPAEYDRVLSEAMKYQVKERKVTVQDWNKFIKKVLISEEDLQARIKELGAEITRDYAGKELLVISILRGGVMITADLIRQINLPLAVEFMAVASYEQGMRQSDGDVRITLDLRTPIKGRHVLIVEDIIPAQP